jgi:multidrug efflux system outer membrane protein
LPVGARWCCDTGIVIRRSLLLLPLLLASCDLAPHYVRPAGAAPASFPQGGAYLPESGEGTVATIGWKRFFTDPRLQQTIALGLANNRDLRVAAADILAARAEYRAQRAELFPTISGGTSAAARHTAPNGTSVSTSGGSGGGSSGNTNTNSTGDTTGSGSTTGGDTGTGTGSTSGGASSFTSGGQTVQTYSVFAGISSFELDLFGRVRNLTRAAQDQYFASRAGADATRISLISEIASAWLTMASDQDQLKLSRDTLKSFETSVYITRAQFDKGIASELDVRQADTERQQARADVASLTTQIAKDQNALNLLVGTTVAAELLPEGLGTQDRTLSDLPAGLSSAVLLNRPDVIQAEDQLKAQNANIGAARAAFFPTISLTAAAGTASGGLGSLFSGGTFSWNASGSAVQTLFDFGRNRANLQYAKAERDAAVATYEKSVQTAFREVSDALATRGTIGEQIAAQQQRAVSAERAATLSLARYQAGIDQYLTTLDSQRTAYSAEQTLVTTRLTRATNLVTLYQVLGGGLSS